MDNVKYKVDTSTLGALKILRLIFLHSLHL